MPKPKFDLTKHVAGVRLMCHMRIPSLSSLFPFVYWANTVGRDHQYIQRDLERGEATEQSSPHINCNYVEMLHMCPTGK